MEELNEINMTDLNDTTSDLWKEDHIKKYMEIKALMDFTELPISVDISQDKMDKNQDVWLDYVITTLKLVTSLSSGIHTDQCIENLKTVALAQIQYIRNIGSECVACDQCQVVPDELECRPSTPESPIERISNECFREKSFIELVEIYNAMPNRMPRACVQMAAVQGPAPNYTYTENMRNSPPPDMAQQPAVQGQDPLAASVVSQTSLQDEKQELGELIFPFIDSKHPDIARKITGMLLEDDNCELRQLLENRESFKAKVAEAVAVLEAHQAKEAESVLEADQAKEAEYVLEADQTKEAESGHHQSKNATMNCNTRLVEEGMGSDSNEQSVLTAGT